jgi:hypothetical protein
MMQLDCFTVPLYAGQIQEANGEFNAHLGIFPKKKLDMIVSN